MNSDMLAFCVFRAAFGVLIGASKRLKTIIDFFLLVVFRENIPPPAPPGAYCIKAFDVVSGIG